jgi:hypothetical protein
MDLTKIPFADPLTLKFYNPLFNEIGDHSLPISFNPKITYLNRAFGFPGSLNVNSPVTTPGKIKTQLLDLEGSWQVKEASEENIEAYFKGNGGNFYSLIRGVKLNEISYGGIKYPAGDIGTPHDVLEHMNTKFNAYYPNDEYAVFCAYMPNGYGEETFEERKLVNEVEWDEYGTPTLKYRFEDYRNDTVYLFVGTVIEYLFAEYGYKIGRNIFKDNAELQHLVIFNTYNRSGWYDFDYRQLVPQILCSDFLKAITNRFNIGFFINEKSKTVDIILFDQLVSLGITDLTTKFISKPNVDNNRVTGMNFPLQPPDAWSSHKLIGMSDFPLCTLEEVNTFRDIVPGVLVSFKIYHVKAENTWYKIVYDGLTYTAERACPNNFPHKEKSGEPEVTQYSGIPAMYRYIKTLEWTVEEGYPPAPVTHSTEADYVMPRCDLECTDKRSPNKEFPLMFVFARGIQNGYTVPAEGAPIAVEYPMGSNTIYSTNGDVIEGATLSLSWDGSAGLIENFWKKRIDWEMNFKKIVTGLLTINDLNKLIDFSQVVRIENNNYIVDYVEAEITPRNVRITDARLFRL